MLAVAAGGGGSGDGAAGAGWSAGWPEASAALPRGAVVVVLLGLDRPARQAEWAGLLDGAERERAARFATAALRARFVAAHGQLRELLGACAGRPAAALAFARGARGKPALVDGGGLEFSLSHAGGLALCALARGRRVGVDLEPLDPGRAGADPLALAATCCAPEELAALRRLPAGVLADAFLGCWTRKEAFAKATGAGLLAPLADFAVSVPPEAPRLLRPPRSEPARWSFAPLPPLLGHAAALVVEGGGAELVTCRADGPGDVPQGA